MALVSVRRSGAGFAEVDGPLLSTSGRPCGGDRGLERGVARNKKEVMAEGDE